MGLTAALGTEISALKGKLHALGQPAVHALSRLTSATGGYWEGAHLQQNRILPYYRLQTQRGVRGTVGRTHGLGSTRCCAVSSILTGPGPRIASMHSCTRSMLVTVPAGPQPGPGRPSSVVSASIRVHKLWVQAPRSVTIQYTTRYTAIVANFEQEPFGSVALPLCASQCVISPKPCTCWFNVQH